MQRRWVFPILFFILILSGFFIPRNSSVQASVNAQLPTVAMATVTGTPVGPVAIVKAGNEPQANLRSGPGALFDRVGILLTGQSVPAKGRSPGGDWILVEYPGVPGGTAWIYSPLVDIKPPVQLPIVEPPPSPTPPQTATIDPTLAARFVITEAPTRLPTFTPPPPLVIPTFVDNTGPSLAGIPMGFVIMGLAALGVFFGVVAFAQR